MVWHISDYEDEQDNYSCVLYRGGSLNGLGVVGLITVG